MENKIVNASEFDSYNNDYTSLVNVDGVDVVIKYTISMSEAIAFVDSVTSISYSGVDHTYSPEVRDFAVRVNTIARYTNIKLPDNTEDKYVFVYSGTIFDTVVDSINMAQFKSIMFGIDHKIRYINDTNVSAIQKEILSITNDMEKFGKAISDMFGDVDKNTFNAIVASLSDGKFDENKLASEVFKLVQKEKDSD